jgi:ubiquinone/menaquinone biosynthesis C-methylase UbiE
MVREMDNNFSRRYKEEFEHQYKEFITKEDLREGKLSSLVSHRIRIPVVENFKNKFNVNHKNILDIGCSSGAFTRIYLNNQNKVFGLDMNLSSLKKARENQIEALLGNVLNLPLKDKVFDVINFTEVIEHLSNPLQALKEINRVLKGKGLLLLTTNNRCAVSVLDIINPIIVIEKTLGVYIDSILPPASLLGGDGDKNAPYHTEFSKKETNLLLDKSGFRIIYQSSTHIFYGKEFIFDCLPFFVSPVKLARILYRIEKTMLSFWFLKYLGEHWEIVAVKNKI